MISRDYPALYRAAESASAEAQKAHYHTYKAFVGLSILGAALALHGIRSEASAVAAAAIFIAALFVSVMIAVKRYESTWYSARALAESIKTNVWRFVMRAEPFAGEEREASSTFRTMLRQILNEHRALGAEFAGAVADAEQITEQMQKVRAGTTKARLEHYKTCRIDEQCKWYTKKAKYNKDAAAFWFWAMVVLQAGAVGLSLARVLAPSWTYWPTEVLVVAAGAVLGWTQTKRFRELASAYSLTAHEIGLARNEANEVVDEITLSRFVNQTENAFSREHTQWIARRE